MEFERVKLLLTTTTTVKPFNPSLKSILMTDASRLYRIGFHLLQPLPGEKLSLIQRGSASLTPTQTNYSIIKLAIQWAIQKSFKIFQKSICNLDNPRLMRMREKVMEYTPEVKWVRSKTHNITDALSRSPMFDTNEEDYAISCNYQSVKTVWDSIKTGAKSAKYANLQKAVQTGICGPETSQFKILMHWLSLRQIEDVLMVVLDSTRLVIPDNSQKAVLTKLHKAHSGISKAYATATQLYYWPGMKNCIKTFLSSCQICLKLAPSQARPPVTGTAR